MQSEPFLDAHLLSEHGSRSVGVHITAGGKDEYFMTALYQPPHELSSTLHGRIERAILRVAAGIGTQYSVEVYTYLRQLPIP